MRIFKVFAVFAVVAVLAVSSQALGANSTPGWSNSEVNYDASTGYLTWVDNYTGTANGTAGTSTNPFLQTFAVFMAGNVGAVNGAPGVDPFTGYTPLGYYPIPSGTTDLSNNWSYSSGNDTTGSEIDWAAPVDPNTKANHGAALPANTYLLAQLPTGLTAAAFGNSAQGGVGDTSGAVLIYDASGNPDYLTVNIENAAVPEPTALVGMFGASIIGLAGFFGRRLRKSAV
jgi:hypothetical protein